MSADFTGAAVCASLFVALAAVAGQGLPRSRAERTQFEETSSGQDVGAFLESLASQTPRMRVESFGMSEEGRPLPLVVIGDPPFQPDEARKSGRPIVLVIANIHAGEVEGKEALLH